MGGRDQGGHLLVGPEVRVHPGVVHRPVPVVAGGDVGADALHPAVLEHRGHPHRGDAHVVEVVQLVDQPGEVTAVVEALVRRVQPVHQATLSRVDAGGVVGGVTVGEPVGHHEVELLADARLPQARAGKGGVPGQRPAALALDGDGGDVVRRREGDRDQVADPAHGEGDVSRAPVGAERDVPALVERDLELVAADRQCVGGEGVGAVAVGVLQPGAQAVRLPVPGAAELALEVAGRRRDGRADVVGDPVALVVVVELHRRVGGQGQRDVVGSGVQPVALGPPVVERGLVLPGARGHGERALPDVVDGVGGQVRGRAVGLPVTRAAELALQVAGDRHRARVRGARRPGGRHRCGDEGGQQAPRHQDPGVWTQSAHVFLQGGSWA